LKRAKVSSLRQNGRMITKSLGMLLLAIYFILIGIMALFHTIVIPDTVKGILALAAGIFILIGR
jgi:cytochrome c biogenesis protein CcdA